MQSYKTNQVGGRASQVGGITCIFKVRKRIIELSVMAVIRPRWMAVATNNIMQVVNIILKLLVTESKIEYLQ